MFAAVKCVLGDTLMRMVTDYVKVNEREFYDLFPEALAWRIKKDYDHKKQTIDDLQHSLDDKPYYEQIDYIVRAVWYRCGQLHRDNGPAIISAKRKYVDRHEWNYQKRIVRSYLTLEYYYRDMRHRTNGPAYIDGLHNTWYLYNVRVKKPADHKHVCVKIDYIPAWISRYYRDTYMVDRWDDWHVYVEDQPNDYDYKTWVSTVMNNMSANIDNKYEDQWKKDFDTARNVYLNDTTGKSFSTSHSNNMPHIDYCINKMGELFAISRDAMDERHTGHF